MNINQERYSIKNSSDEFLSNNKSKYSTSLAKRIFDLFFCLLISPIVILLIFLTVLVYPIFGGFKIFFRHERIGLNGKKFNLYKIRTFSENSLGHLKIVDKDEFEIIPVIGNFLRLSRIDELPQILNILRGDMSWIGPRPEQSKYVKDIILQTPEYKFRHIVRPGITGLAQINNPNATFKDYEEKLKFDLEYISKSGLFFDLKIFYFSLVIILKNIFKSN